MDRQKKFVLVSYGSLIVLFAVCITYLTVKFAPGLTHLIKEPEQFRNLLAAYGTFSIPIFILFQIIQVVIAAIPGELVQLAGGYVYGTFWGTVYSGAGILLGSVFAFYIARWLGFSLLKKFVSQKELEKFAFLMNSPKSEITMFLLFLIPGIPKDFLVYIAGVTPIKPANFFLIFFIGRFPGLLASSYIGANIHEKRFLPVIIVSVIACVLFVVGLIKKDLVIHKLQHTFHIKSHPEKET